MATKALTGLVAEWFTPEDQKPHLQDPDLPEGPDNPLIEVPDPTRYKLKPLDGLQFMEVAAEGETRADGTFMPNHVGRVLLLRYGVKDWENVTDNGQPLAFNLARLKLIKTPHLVACANELLTRSVLGDDDAKN